jgi:uncharacterized membrane protein
MIFDSKIEVHDIVVSVFTVYSAIKFYNIRIVALTTVVHKPSLFPSAD